MARIKVAVSGDQWCNREQVIDQIQEFANAKHLVFEINTEGPSLYALGFIDTVLEQVQKTNIPVDKIWVDNWHNTVEDIPFKRAYRPRISHFFWMSECYRHTIPTETQQKRLFGLFIGRITVPRAKILYDVFHDFSDQSICSLMQENSAEVNLAESLVPWVLQPHHQQQLRDWFRECPLTSITNHAVRDQYRTNYNTNAALIKHYGKFNIEIVCETYCLGTTFFPTEKTIRPISQSKPMIIFGPKNFLKHLQKLGFCTWNDLWDESYDEYEGHDRWLIMRETMYQIQESWPRVKSSCEKICDHNLKCLDKMIEAYKPGC